MKNDKHSRRNSNKNGEGMVIVIRKHVKAFKDVGLIPDEKVDGKRFEQQLPFFAKNWNKST